MNPVTPKENSSTLGLLQNVSKPLHMMSMLNCNVVIVMYFCLLFK